MQTIKIVAKCVDAFWARLDEDGKEKGQYDGYVPNWFPNPNVGHFGDYIELTINIETGQILNWKRPNKEDLKIFDKKNADL